MIEILPKQRSKVVSERCIERVHAVKANNTFDAIAKKCNQAKSKSHKVYTTVPRSVVAHFLDERIYPLKAVKISFDGETRMSFIYH